MRHQLHHQNKQDRIQVKVIVEFTAKEAEKEYWDEVHTLMAENPPPDGDEFLICEEESEHFVRGVDMVAYQSLASGLS